MSKREVPAHMLSLPDEGVAGTEMKIPFMMGWRKSGFPERGRQIVVRFPKPHGMNVIE
jgi:hypothetical protein